MIKKIILSNFILIDKLEVNFNKGFNVITGETGAGKSILMGAIDLVLGSKLKSTVAYNQEEPVYLQADFSIDNDNPELMSLIEELDLDTSDEELFFSKKINTLGKATSYINGIRVTNSVIIKFRDQLIDFHNQNDQQLLLKQDYQLDILDSYANILSERDEFNRELDNLKDLRKQIKDLISEEQAKREKHDLYMFQINEIESFSLKEGEDTDLEDEIELLGHAEDIIKYSNELRNEVYENDNSIYDKLQTITRSLGNIKSEHSGITNLRKTLDEALVILDELAAIAGDIPDSIDSDPARLEELTNRSDAINELKTKYHRNSIAGILEYYKTISQEVSKDVANKKQLEDLLKKEQQQVKKLNNLGEKLSELRQKASIKLANELQTQIRKLAMPDSHFQILIDKKSKLLTPNNSGEKELVRNGFDSVNFFFSSNKGIDTKVLKKAVSGGELSRVMLAVKKVLSGYIMKRLLIFDEIDSGIGGKTADTISGILFEMSRFHQILCITHLPQIASVGENHLHISKDSSGEKTMTVISTLNGEKRVEEIARMLSGIESSIALQHAEELLKRNKWSNNGNK